jgi:hypothetical protein
MSLTIEEIQNQINTLQQTLDDLKTPKLEISRNFTGQYFAPYKGVFYRRMESDGVPIWETFLDIKKEWVAVAPKELKELEKIFQSDCITKEEGDG